MLPHFQVIALILLIAVVTGADTVDPNGSEGAGPEVDEQKEAAPEHIENGAGAEVHTDADEEKAQQGSSEQQQQNGVLPTGQTDNLKAQQEKATVDTVETTDKQLRVDEGDLGQIGEEGPPIGAEQVRKTEANQVVDKHTERDVKASAQTVPNSGPNEDANNEKRPSADIGTQPEEDPSLQPVQNLEWLTRAVAKFAYEQPSLSPSDSGRRFPANAVADNFLAKLAEVADKDILIVKRPSRAFACRQDLEERMAKSAAFGRTILGQLIGERDADKLIAQEAGTRPFKLLFSFAARLAAALGQDKNGMCHLRTFLSAYDCFNNVDRLGGEIIYDLRIESINGTPKKGGDERIPLALKSGKTVQNEEGESRHPEAILIGPEQGAAERDRENAATNFDFLRSLSLFTLTAREAVVLVQKIEHDIGVGLALTGTGNKTNDYANNVFAALVTHLERSGKKVPPAQGQQQFVLRSDDQLCAICAFGANLLARLRRPSLVDFPLRAKKYFRAIGALDAFHNLPFLEQTLRNSRVKYCAAMEADVESRQAFAQNEHFQHFEEAIRIDWNPWTVFIRMLGEVRAAMVVKESRVAFRDAFAYNPQELTIDEGMRQLEQATKMLDAPSEIGAAQTHFSQWKAAVREAERRGDELLDSLEKMSAKMESAAGKFDQEHMMFIAQGEKADANDRTGQTESNN